MSHVLPNISRGRFFEPIFTSKKFNLYTSIYGKCSLFGMIKFWFNQPIIALGEKIKLSQLRTQGVLPSKRLMGSHFHNWIDYKFWVAFLLEFNYCRMGSHIFRISGEKILVSRDLKIGRFSV